MVSAIYHITYPYTPGVAKIFLKESKSARYKAERNGVDLGTDTFTKEFMEHLIKKGFTFTKVNRTYLVARKNVCKIPVEISKIVENGEIKEILVKLPATNIREANKYLATIQDHVEKEAGVVGVEHLWYRGHC